VLACRNSGSVATGVLSGLVAITPAAFFVTPMTAIPIGAITSFVCYKAVGLKERFEYDDSLDGLEDIGV
jgi:Ammonia permease